MNNEAKFRFSYKLGNLKVHLTKTLVIFQDLCNKLDLPSSDIFWLENGIEVDNTNIIETKRIGIESAGQEWANKPFRYYIYDNKSVSVRDKTAEANRQT